MMMSAKTSNHAGLLIPLDMFRISQLTALIAEQLVSKARNILDAKLILTRHLHSPILLVRIEGHVVGGDPAAFWRENADLAALASRIFPRQVILYYYAQPGLPATRREGFVVTQQGQALGADDATADRMPPDATELDWPLARLCQQLRISTQELAEGFPGGPSVDVQLVEPNIDDQLYLMKLLGRDGADESEADEASPAPGPRPAAMGRAAPSTAAPRPAAGAPQAAPRRANLDEDAKRRAQKQATQVAEQARRAAEIRADLPYETDPHGVIVAPKADLSEPDILRPYIHSKLEGDLPPGLPKALEGEYQGRRVDIAVRVEFLSEVFVENNPLNRPLFESRAQPLRLEDRDLLQLEVLGPRLGYGTLVSSGKVHVFVSRKSDLPLPTRLILELLSQ